MTFANLVNELKLKLNYENDAQLQLLEQWCEEHISNDIHFQGSSDEKYNHYLSFAEHYLDVFLSHVPARAHLAVEVPEFNKLNAIQYAAQHGYNHFIKGTSVIPSDVLDRRNDVEMTPLHVCAAKGYVHTLQALLDKGANPRKTNRELQLPIHSALFVPMSHEEDLILKKIAIFKALIACDPQSLAHKDSRGETAFHLMATEEKFCPILSELLRENSRGIFICNNFSRYPIHTAILNNQFFMVELLLSIDGVALLADSEQRVALHYAARYSNAKMVQLCCDATPDINIRDKTDKTPLILAAEAQNIEAIKTLFKNGADVTLVDYLGQNILHIAVDMMNKELVFWILDNTALDSNQVDAHGDTLFQHCQLHFNT